MVRPTSTSNIPILRLNRFLGHVQIKTETKTLLGLNAVKRHHSIDLPTLPIPEMDRFRNIILMDFRFCPFGHTTDNPYTLVVINLLRYTRSTEPCSSSAFRCSRKMPENLLITPRSALGKAAPRYVTTSLPCQSYARLLVCQLRTDG